MQPRYPYTIAASANSSLSGLELRFGSHRRRRPTFGCPRWRRSDWIQAASLANGCRRAAQSNGAYGVLMQIAVNVAGILALPVFVTTET
jgi:hypothetical protein